jgi:hypothetical protein
MMGAPELKAELWKISTGATWGGDEISVVDRKEMGDKLVVVPNLTKLANYSGDEMEMTSSRHLPDEQEWRWHSVAYDDYLG